MRRAAAADAHGRFGGGEGRWEWNGMAYCALTVVVAVRQDEEGLSLCHDVL